MNKKRIFIVAGELSGDLLGSKIVHILKKNYPEILIEGVCGFHMKNAGCTPLYSIESFSLLGIFELIWKLPLILILRYKILRHLKLNRPDLYIGVDFPEFNLSVQKILKKNRVPVIHFVSPKIWAWREYRIRKIKLYTDCIFSIFPFEINIYKKYKHKCVFIGHPLANIIPIEKISSEIYKRRLGYKNTTLIISLFPGSRYQEVLKMLPIFLKSILLLKNKGYLFETTLSIASKSLFPFIDKYKLDIIALHIKVVYKNPHLSLKVCDIALVTCGTIALEAMLFKRSMVVCYKVSKLTSIILKKMIKISFFSLPNIIFKKKLVSELIQSECNPEKCSKQLEKLINRDYYKNINLIQKFTKIHKSLIVEGFPNKILVEVNKFLS